MINATGFSFAYAEQKDSAIFQNASLDIAAGTVTAVIGPNGSGKTTLFELILGSLKPTQGEIRVSADANDRVIMPQTISAPWLLSVSEILDFIFSLNTRGEISEKEFLENLSESEKRRFKKIKDRRFGRCSAGERAWLLSSLLLTLPRKLYILDEPTAGVDPEFRVLIWDRIKRVAERGATILVSTHLLDEVGAHSQRVVMINDTKLIAFSSIADMIQATGTKTSDQAFISLVGERF